MSAEAPPIEPPPRYRHFTVPPAIVRLTVDDITALLPEGAWIGTDADKTRELPLPAAEILETNFPRIRFTRLRDLLPGCIASPAAPPEWIALPTDRVALAYRPETRREAITAPGAEPGIPAEAPSPAPEKPLPSWKRLLKPTLAPPPAPPAAAESAIEEPATPPSSAPIAAPAPTPIPLADLRLPADAESRLQQIFMTEDPLPVSRLVELAGALPALQGCALSRGAEQVRSPGLPPGLDVPALGDATLDLLQKTGSSSGLRLQPALTLYADSGPISLLHRGDCRLLVAHRERGFLPGVREKLDAVLELLAGTSQR